MTFADESALVEALVAGDPAAEPALAALARERAEVAVDLLKARLDALVRKSPRDAQPLADLLVRCSEHAPARRAIALRGRAMVAHANQRSAAALVDYQAALALHEAAGEELDAARVQRSLVDVLQMSGRSEEALEVGARARATLERLGDRRLLAQLLCNVGNVHFRLDAYPEATRCYEEARAWFVALGDRLGLAFALFNLGNTATNANRFEEARAAYAESESVFREQGHAVLAADARYSAAYLDMRSGDYASAHEGLTTARADYERGGKPSGAPLCDLDLSEMHLRLGAAHDALECARSASARFAELGMDYELAKARSFAGLALVQLERADEAREELDAAARLFTRVGNEPMRALLAIQRPRGAAFALADVEAAARTLADTGAGFLAQFGAAALARARHDAGDRNGAEEALSGLFAQGGEGALERLVLEDALDLSAELALERGDRVRAREQLERSLELARAGLSTIVGGDVRIAFARGRQERAARLAHLVLESGESGAPAAALEILDATRQRCQDELRERSSHGTDAEAALRERADALLARRLDSDLGPASARLSGAVARDLASELDVVHRELAALGRRSGPRRADEGLEVLDRRRALAAGERVFAHLVEPGGRASRGTVWALVGDREGVTAERCDTTLARVVDLVEELRFEIERRVIDLGADERRARAGRARIDRCLAALGDALVPRALRDQVRGPLVVVPYGVLHDVPYHALLVDGAPLVQRCEISYSSSLRALARARSRRGRAHGSWWLCGASDERTPRIERELAAIAELGGSRVRRVAPSELVSVLRTAETGPSVLHVASHGAFRPDHPLLSGLRLGDRFLTTFDVHRTVLDVELVALSGCETGRRARRRGEELVGPEQAFLASGARAVLGSGWTVADEHASRCMEALYAELARGTPLRRALARVQRAEFERDGHPFAWAAFHVSGDPDVVLTRPVSDTSRTVSDT
jgi:tetratricopeptide (TPR) repeat protein